MRATDTARWLEFVAAALATWRVAHLITFEDGPWDLIVRLRKRAGHGFLGRAMDCFHCSSLWVAAAAALSVAGNVRAWLLYWPALSGAACLLDRLGRDPVVIQNLNEGDSTDALLRSEQRGGENDSRAITGNQSGV